MRTDIVFDIETNGLAPLNARVAAIGIKTEQEEVVLMNNDESVLLKQFWQFLKKFEYFRLIGFNTSAFDIPFLNVRSFRNETPVLDVRGKSVDLRSILSYGNKYAKGTLNDYAKLIGIEPKYNNWTGAHAVILWQNGQLSELKEYVLQDIRITYKIYERCKKIGLI